MLKRTLRIHVNLNSALSSVKDYLRPMSCFVLIIICILMHPVASHGQVDYSNAAAISLKSGLFSADYEHFDDLYGLDKGIYYGGSILLPVRLPFYIYLRLNYIEIRNDSDIDPDLRVSEASHKQRTIAAGVQYRLTINHRFRVAANTGVTIVKAEEKLWREGASEPSENELWNFAHGYFVGLNADMYDRNFPLAIFFEFQKSFRFRPYTGIDFNNGLVGNSFGIGVRYYLNPPQRKRLF